MRRISMSIFALALLAEPVFAADAIKASCQSYATAVADEWAAGYIARAEEGSAAEAGEVLIIAAGKKYYVPSSGSGVLTSVGQRIRERKKIYWDTYHRCMKGGDITINISPSAATAE